MTKAATTANARTVGVGRATTEAFVSSSRLRRVAASMTSASSRDSPSAHGSCDGSRETGAAPTALTVGHLDRCLSCLSCESTCPSGVSYRRLIDPARELIETRYRRPALDRALRALLAWLLTGRRRFAAALHLGRGFRPLLHLAGRAWKPLAALARMVPETPPAGRAITPGTYPAEGRETRRVLLVHGLLRGRAQSLLVPLQSRYRVRLVLTAPTGERRTVVKSFRVR